MRRGVMRKVNIGDLSINALYQIVAGGRSHGGAVIAHAEQYVRTQREAAGKAAADKIKLALSLIHGQPRGPRISTVRSR